MGLDKRVGLDCLVAVEVGCRRAGEAMDLDRTMESALDKGRDWCCFGFEKGRDEDTG